MRATRFLWEAAGRPHPTETDGTALLPRDLHAEAQAKRRALTKKLQAALEAEDGATITSLESAIAAVVDAPACASCGELAAHRIDDAISDSFTTVKNASRAWAFGGASVCQGCLWACRSLALRCSMWFARLPDAHGVGGVWFVPMRPIPGWPGTRPDPLSALLAPPPPPFVAGLPLYGIEHGGEANAHRVIWPWAGEAEHPRARAYSSGPRLYVPFNPLVKLQSKHTALYATVSLSRERYQLQVDDTGDVTVDVPLWRRLRAVCDALLVELRAAGVGAQEAKRALETGEPPRSAPLALLATWRARVASIRPHVGGAWWGLFVNLLLMPELTPQARTAG